MVFDHTDLCPFWTRSHPCGAPIKVDLPLCRLYARKTRERLNGFSWKLILGSFFWNLSAHYNFGRTRTRVTGALHEDLHACLRTEVTGWGIPSGESPAEEFRASCLSRWGNRPSHQPWCCRQWQSPKTLYCNSIFIRLIARENFMHSLTVKASQLEQK
jgi:hypothetical protein